MRLNKTIIFSITLISLFMIAPLATVADPLFVTTQEVTNINERSATANGRIVTGDENYCIFFFCRSITEVDEYGIYWNTTDALNTATDQRSDRDGADLPLEFSIEMKDLQPRTTYYVWAYTLLPNGKPVIGNRISFTTTQQPEVSTQAVTDIGSTTATGNGTISILGIPAPIQHGVCWGTKRNPTIEDEKTEKGVPNATGPFSSRITGLKTDKKYYVRAYATNAVGTVYGKQVSFETMAGSPVISTQAVTDITTRSATAHATFVNIGDPPATQYGVCWNTDRMPDYNPENCIDKGKPVEEGSFTIQINELQPGATYYLRAFASNAPQEYYYGKEISFTTYDLPAVSTQSVSGTNTNEVIANGTIESLGNPVPTAHGFCWNMAGSQPIAEECIDLAPPMTLGPFVATLTDLLPGTTYFVRAFTTNEIGTAYGEERSFTTIDETSAPRAMITNPPSALTRQTAYQLNVAGSRTVQYRFSLDDSPWSEPKGIDEAISFPLTDEGPHWLLVQGKDETGIWQARQSATLVTWSLDTTPPNAELPNAPKGTIGSLPASILVQGNDVVAYRYSLNESPWSTIYPVSMPITLPELQIGGHTLAVIGADLASNWQDKDNATTIEWKVDTSVPTALLTDLPYTVTNETSISIGVAAPEDGTSVKEYFYQIDDNHRWTYGNISQTIDQSWPQGGEEKHTICVNAGDGAGVWQDGSDGQSSIESATCYTWRIDLTPVDSDLIQIHAQKAPPLYIHEGLWVDSRAVTLWWSWQSKDDREALRRYRIWHSEKEITETNLHEAVELYYDRQPGPQGYLESFVVQNLAVGKTHYFRIKAIDMAGNSSKLSIPVEVTLEDRVPQITHMVFKQGGVRTDNASLETLVLTGTNVLNNTAGNFARFENSEAGFILPATVDKDGKLLVQIPLGMPSDIYWVRIVNANGMSPPGSEMITILDADKPLPTVRNITPRIAQVAQEETSIDLIITGEHFGQSPGVSLVARDGNEYHQIYNVNVLDAQTIHATVNAVDIPEGFYDIRVRNAEAEYNQFSAVRLELYTVQHLKDLPGGIETDKIVQLEDGVIPVVTTLKTRDNLITGTGDGNRLKMKILLMPGLTFEVEQPNQSEALPYHGHLLPPRETRASARVVADLGEEALHLTVGADVPLRLKTGAVFATLEVMLPEHLSTPRVYYITPDGGLEPAGIRGTWQDIDIEKGGTVLSVRPNTPESGLTTYTLGLLLDHFSEYAVGSSVNNGYSDFLQGSDDYGPCFIDAAR